MTAGEVISIADDMMPNQYDSSTKLRWLKMLDEQLYREVILTHAADADLDWESTDDTEYESDDDLLIGYPYCDNIYVPYLQTRVCQENGEISKYNVYSEIYTNGLTDWTSYWRRNHRPNPSGHWRY